MGAEVDDSLRSRSLNVRKFLPEILEDAENQLSVIFREQLSALYEEVVHLDSRIESLEQSLKTFCAQNEDCKRLLTIPGIGLMTATALIEAVGDISVFKNGRELAALLGLVPRQHSTGGKPTLLGISKRGDSYLRTLLIHGGRAVVRCAHKHQDKRSQWVGVVEGRRGKNITAVAVANKLAGDKVVFVAGHFCSGSSIPASAVYAEEGILQISPASTNPKFTDERPGNNIFRVCGRDDQQGSVAGAYLKKNFGDKRVAVVHDKQAYSKGLADETKKAMNAAGLKEVMYETVTPGEKDYNALVSKLKQAKTDVLYYGGYHPEAGLIVRQMRGQGMDTILVSGDALVTADYWKITGPAGEGTLMTFSPDPRKNPAAAELVKRFREKGVEPEGYVLYTYAAFQAWKQAVEAVESTDPEKVSKALHEGKFKTVIGDFSFDKKGDPSLPPYAFFKWSKGEYEQIN